MHELMFREQTSAVLCLRFYYHHVGHIPLVIAQKFSGETFSKMNLIIFLLVFFQGLSAIKCRNNGIEHITDKGREFCECKGDFWGEQCEEEDVSRGTKLGCRYVYLNDKPRFNKNLEIR